MRGLLALVGVTPRDVPVEPEPDEAREWLITELSKPTYEAARPTLLDRIAQAISDWFSSLTLPEGPPGSGFALILLIIAAAIVLAVVIFGLPRLNRRSRVTGSLFGDDDDRDASAMRRDSAAAAARGDYTLAVAERFRAIARGLAERLILTTFPGTTARGFADEATTLFPEHAPRLVAAAVTFDGVRYLGSTGTAAHYAELVALDDALSALKPTGARP